MSVRVSQQCEADTLAGNRCRNRTARGRHCWQHLKKEQGLRVKASGVPNAGLGLYATRRIPKGRVIARYEGEEMTRTQVQRRYGSKRGEYVYCKSKRKCRDARRSNAGVARFANDSRGTKQRNNARLTTAFSLKATANIPAGRKVLASYGAAYWKNKS